MLAAAPEVARQVPVPEGPRLSMVSLEEPPIPAGARPAGRKAEVVAGGSLYSDSGALVDLTPWGLIAPLVMEAVEAEDPLPLLAAMGAKGLSRCGGLTNEQTLF